MDTATIQELYEYNRWANSRVLEAVSKLAAEEFTRDLQSSHCSVRDTLIHMMSGEWIWLVRWKGMSPKAMLDPAEYPTSTAVRARWADLQREQAEFVASLTGESLRRVVRYVNLRGEAYAYPLSQMMHHVVNHSTYHRGQVVTMLRQLGATPAATDFLVFYDSAKG